MNNRFKNRIAIIIYCLIVFLLGGCSKTETLDFEPGLNLNSIYKFNVSPPLGMSAPNDYYTIKGYTLMISDTLAESPSFLLRGRDTLKNADIVLNAKCDNYGSVSLNVNIAFKTQKKFYKNCNFSNATMSKGKNNKGRYIKLSFQAGMYVTQKLVSERNMNPECVVSNFDPIIYYY